MKNGYRERPEIEEKPILSTSSKKALLFLSVSVLLVLIILLLIWASCSFQGFCRTQKTSQDETVQNINNKMEPLHFEWESTQAEKTDDIEELGFQVISHLGKGKEVIITGLFNSFEENTSPFENLGVARANAIARELEVSIMTGVVIEGREVPGIFNETKIALQDAYTITFVDETQTIGESEREISRIVRKIDREIIYFPFNSSDEFIDNEVETYLQALTKEVLNSGESLVVIGHTDDVGSDSYNQLLGLGRAETVRERLVEIGVDVEKLETLSRGEDEPTETNETDEGRQLNRRVEIFKKK